MDQVDEGLAAFVPTDADVESLAVCLYACMYEYSFATGKKLLLESLPSEISYSWRRVARAAFDHAGYLPSITAAHRDALNTYTYERRQHATETATWKDRCGNLEAQLKVSPRERSDNNLSQPCPYRAYVPGSMPLLEAAMAQSADFQRARSDVWVATGSDTAMPIDSITRLIKIAHETKDPELRKLATSAAAVLLHPHCPMASA